MRCHLIGALALFIVIPAQSQDASLKQGVFYDHLTGKDQEEILVNSSTTFFEKFTVKAICLKKQGASFKNESSDEETLLIVKEGFLKATLSANDKIIGPGSVVWVLPGEGSQYENAGKAPVKFYLFKFKSRLPMNVERGKTGGGSFVIDWNDIVAKPTDKGERRDFFNKPTASCSKYEMHVTTLNEGLDSHLPHTHAEEEIILLLKGEVNMEIDGKLYPASVGAMVFLPSKLPHALHNVGKGACQYFAFQWKNEN